MKKLFFLLVFAAAGSWVFGQSADSTQNMAAFKWESQSFDFGDVKQGTPVTHEFTFTNTGNVPLVITNVRASCGCTTPDWSKDPIPAGKDGYIKATYNAAAQGGFNKTVTVTANVPEGSVVLSIHGTVVAANQ